MTGPMTPGREAELREDALELDHGQLVRALREALDAMAFERARAEAAEAKLDRVHLRDSFESCCQACREAEDRERARKKS